MTTEELESGNLLVHYTTSSGKTGEIIISRDIVEVSKQEVKPSYLYRWEHDDPQ